MNIDVFIFLLIFLLEFDRLLSVAKILKSFFDLILSTTLNVIDVFFNKVE